MRVARTAGPAGGSCGGHERILVDADLRRRLCLAGVARVRDEYTLETMVERTLAVYEIARHRRRSIAEKP